MACSVHGLLLLGRVSLDQPFPRTDLLGRAGFLVFSFSSFLGKRNWKRAKKRKDGSSNHGVEMGKGYFPQGQYPTKQEKKKKG